MNQRIFLLMVTLLGSSVSLNTPAYAALSTKDVTSTSEEAQRYDALIRAAADLVRHGKTLQDAATEVTNWESWSTIKSGRVSSKQFTEAAKEAIKKKVN